MIYLDTNGFDKQHYKFDYVRREFLGEVRTLVFDVEPLPKAGKGRFSGRIWVEDQDFHIVRFNGAYSGSSRTNYYFHFDSWRVNTGPNLWLPAFIYSEESDLNFALSKRLSFKAQTRLWGYNLGHSAQEQELSKILIESQMPVKDQTTTANDINPVMAQRNWDRQAEDNVVDRLERLGLLAPAGEVDKVLDTVVNNLEVTNNLDIQPEIRCRVLLTSTLESFAIGHTIVFSRGLIDVLPDEMTWPPWSRTNWRTSFSATALTGSTRSSIACCLTRRTRSGTSALPARKPKNPPPTPRPMSSCRTRRTRNSWPRPSFS